MLMRERERKEKALCISDCVSSALALCFAITSADTASIIGSVYNILLVFMSSGE